MGSAFRTKEASSVTEITLHPRHVAILWTSSWLRCRAASRHPAVTRGSVVTINSSEGSTLSCAIKSAFLLLSVNRHHSSVAINLQSTIHNPLDITFLKKSESFSKMACGCGSTCNCNGASSCTCGNNCSCKACGVSSEQPVHPYVLSFLMSNVAYRVCSLTLHATADATNMQK